MNKYLLIVFTIAIVIGGCEELIEPADENRQGLNDIYSYPYYAEGVLMNAYTLLPTNNYSFNEVATDDAVSNDKTNGFLRMANGQWSSINNPMDIWTNAYTAISYINLFLSNVDSVTWSVNNKDVNRMFKDRLKGEAYGLRAIFFYYLLQAHGGYSADGELLGVPVITEVLNEASDFNKPRNTFAECIQQIYSDIEQAENYLPFDYVKISKASQVPSKYAGINYADYGIVFGEVNNQRISRRLIRGIKAKVALLDASPAFNPDDIITKWEDAANYAALVIDSINGIAGLDAKGALFYTKTNVDIISLSAFRDQKEMLWRGSMYTGYGMEQNNFPPSLYGRGRVNPTQNLIEAFPMSNGYPITNANSGYIATNPYVNRDPRLNNYIVRDGASMSSVVIRTTSGKDGVDSISTSTRTGYYLRKLMREDVNLNPTILSGQKHYPVHLRYTEIYLSYAEAANEAWGPDGRASHNYSARQVIAAIRNRAGISPSKDLYLPTITTKEDMRKVIRNERRIELCFEGYRFWDLRRWKEDLTQPAKGIKLTTNGYEVVTVENRVYQDYMYYGPIPYNEVLRANLIQNKGW